MSWNLFWRIKNNYLWAWLFEVVKSSKILRCHLDLEKINCYWIGRLSSWKWTAHLDFINMKFTCLLRSPIKTTTIFMKRNCLYCIASFNLKIFISEKFYTTSSISSWSEDNKLSISLSIGLSIPSYLMVTSYLSNGLFIFIYLPT